MRVANLIISRTNAIFSENILNDDKSRLFAVTLKSDLLFCEIRYKMMRIILIICQHGKKYKKRACDLSILIILSSSNYPDPNDS